MATLDCTMFLAPLPLAPSLPPPHAELSAQGRVWCTPAARDDAFQQKQRQPLPLAATPTATGLRPPGKCGTFETDLQRAHDADRHKIAALFAAMPGALDASFIVNTVSPEEGSFLATYLGVPQDNVIKLTCRKFRPNNSTHARMQAALAASLLPHADSLSAVTFLGHMELDDQDRPKFANMAAQDLFAMIAPIRPKRLNFFSCTSQDYAQQMATLFAASGYIVPQITCFANNVEVSQWPKRNGLRMFYAGPELGPYRPAFSPTEHFPVYQAIRTSSATEALPWSVALDVAALQRGCTFRPLQDNAADHNDAA